MAALLQLSAKPCDLENLSIGNIEAQLGVGSPGKTGAVLHGTLDARV